MPPKHIVTQRLRSFKLMLSMLAGQSSLATVLRHSLDEISVCRGQALRYWPMPADLTNLPIAACAPSASFGSGER